MIERPHSPLGARRRTLEMLVRYVAESSLEAVCRLVAQRVEAMTLCEARGYIRARAGREIRRQTRLAIASHPAADAAWELPVIVRATDRVAPLALRQIIGARVRQGETRELAARRQRRAA